MLEFLRDRRPQTGWTYDAYVAQWKQRLDQPLVGLDKTQRRYLFYARYNWARMELVHKAYTPSEALQATVAAIKAPQLWMVLTEDWCVDSAFCLPVIAEAANPNPNIDLRLLSRDANLDIMERYLTGGARSIPKLVAFGPDDTELFRWGPRPQEIQARRMALKEQGATSQELSQGLLAYYETGGWRQVDTELAAILAGLPAGAASIAKKL